MAFFYFFSFFSIYKIIIARKRAFVNKYIFILLRVFYTSKGTDFFHEKVFLLTDWLLNKSGKDIGVYPHGNFDDLYKFIDENL